LTEGVRPFSGNPLKGNREPAFSELLQHWNDDSFYRENQKYCSTKAPLSLLILKIIIFDNLPKSSS